MGAGLFKKLWSKKFNQFMKEHPMKPAVMPRTTTNAVSVNAMNVMPRTKLDLIPKLDMIPRNTVN
jgi:hypothetical protein